MNSDFSYVILIDAVGYLPFLAVYVVGIVISTSHKARMPQASNLTIAAFILLIVNTVGGVALRTWNSTTALTISATPDRSFMTRFAVWHGVSLILSLVSWCLLLSGLHRAFQNQREV